MTQEGKYDTGDFVSAKICGEIVDKKYIESEWWYVVSVGNQKIQLREAEIK